MSLCEFCSCFFKNAYQVLVAFILLAVSLHSGFLSEVILAVDTKTTVVEFYFNGRRNPVPYMIGESVVESPQFPILCV